MASHEREEEIFHSCLELPPAEQSAYVARACRGDTELQTRIERLVAAHRRAEERTRNPLRDVLGDVPNPDELEPAGEEGPPVGRAGDSVGPYRLVRLLAEGGMGSVWLGERSDQTVNRPIALKLPHGAWVRAGLAARMAREREILAALSHPNIARLYDAGLTSEGQPYLALEYVEGRRIDEHCREKGLDLKTRLRLFLKVANAVAHAHAKLIVHRDIKPANILVTDGGQVLLLDFGIAKLLDEGQARETEITKLSGRAFTLDYASPEQIVGEPITIGSDVYSLGVVLYELLTEARPYKPARDSWGALEEAILNADPAKPSDVAGGPFRKALRGDLDTIVQKSLKKKAADRYATVNAFAEDVERYLQGRPVHAQPDRASYRLRKFMARNRLAVGASAAVALALLAGTGVSVWQARVALAEKERAREVKDFVAAIFRDANLEEGEGKSLTALDVLKRARDRVEKGLDTDPTVRVELLNLLGSSLMSLGDAAAAETVVDRAIKEARGQLGAGHPLTLRAGLLRSWVLMFRGKTHEARGGLDEVFRAHEGGRELEAADLVLAWRLRCGLAIDTGNREQAEGAGKEAVRLADLGLPDDHPEKLLALLELAYARQQSGDYDQALPVAERAYRLAAGAHPDNLLHPNVVKARTRYGNALADAGQLPRGIEELERSARDAATLFGPSSATVGVILQNLVSPLLKAGRVADALTSSERAFEICLRSCEPASYTRLSTAKSRGLALVAAHRMRESLLPFDDAYEAAVKTLGPSDRVTVDSRGRRALALAHNGSLALARSEVQAVRDEANRSKVVSVYFALRTSGQVERQAGEYAAALELQERALQQIEGAQIARRGFTLLEIGLLKLELRRYAEAIDALEQAGRLLAQLDDVVEPDDIEVLIGLGRARLQQGRAAEAAKLLEEADRFWRGFDPENRSAGEVSLWLSQAYRSLGRPQAAEQARRRAVSVLSRSPYPSDARLVRMARGTAGP